MLQIDKSQATCGASAELFEKNEKFKMIIRINLAIELGRGSCEGGGV